jgi:hypothetical protein
MTFWDQAEGFRNSILKGDSALRRPRDIRPSISYLRKTLEPNWRDNLSRNHPLSQHLMMSSNQNDLWLEQFAHKVQAVQEVPNHENLVTRLAHPAEYLGAHFELDAALAFLLNGFRVEFIKQSATPTADFQAKKESYGYLVEVTSLNSSHEFERIDRISTYASFQAFKVKENLVSGGIVISAPKSEEALTRIFGAIDGAISEAATKGYARLNLPGVATLYFAKQDSANKIPDDSRNQFRFGKIRSPDTEDRIIAKIREKWDQLGREDSPGVLLINTGFLGPSEMDTLFANSWDSVAVSLSVYPGISSLGVSCPVPILSSPLPYSANGNKISFGSAVATAEYRNYYFWKNKHADVEASPYVFETFLNYASNLKSLDSPAEAQ